MKIAGTNEVIMYIILYIYLKCFMETTNPTELRKKLKEKLDTVSKDGETIIVHRSKAEDVVMIPLSEYNGWKETVHLLSTKANRENLETSIAEIENGAGESREIATLWK